MMPACQLSSNDLQNVRQALVMHNSLDILPAISLFLIPGFGRFLPEFTAEFVRREDVRFANKLWYRGTIGYSW